MSDSYTHDQDGKPRPLDENLYKLDEDEFAFLSSQTGIQDPEELKKHVLSVQKEIYAVGFAGYLWHLMAQYYAQGPSIPLHSWFRLYEVS